MRSIVLTVATLIMLAPQIRAEEKKLEPSAMAEQFLSAASPERLAIEASSSFGFVTRDQLARDLSRRSDGRLQLDPP